MEVEFKCQHCGQSITADAELAGQDAECPGCGRAIVIPSSLLEPGKITGGFRIERCLGRGAMGEVFLATQLSMNREVALKVLPPALSASDPDTVKRFMNEVRLLGRLHHPNIVTAFEAGTDGPINFLAMHYIDGENLASRLQRAGPLPEREALGIVLKVADALRYAWEEFQVLHRDIKPGNIMVDRYGEAHLMDLGISLQTSSEKGLTQVGMVIGTPQYMSPEQAMGVRNLDFRSDIYSLGATLYNLVTGRAPFTDENNLFTGKQTSARQAAPGVSEACAQLIEKMMARSPEERYISWSALISDLNRMLKGEFAAPRAKTPTPAKTSRKLALGIAVGVALLALVAAGFMVMLRSGRSVAPAAPDRTIPSPGPMTTPVKALPAGTPAAEAKQAVDAPAQTAPVADTAARPEALATKLAAAELFERDHPGQYEDIIRNYEAVREDSAGTPVRLQAEAALSRVRQAREEARTRAGNDLKAQADRLVAAMEFDAAIGVYRDYTGPFAVELSAARDAGVIEIEKARKEVAASNAAADDTAKETAVAEPAAGPAASETAAPAADDVERKVQAALGNAAEALARLDFSAAAAALDAAGKDEALRNNPKLAAAGAELANVAKMPERIRASFQAQVGREVELDLGKRKVKIEITEAGDAEVKGRQRLAAGFIAQSVRYADFSAGERYKRLGDARDAETELMRALLLLESRRPDMALPALESAGTPLALALRDAVGDALKPRIAVQAEVKGRPLAGADVAIDGEVQEKKTPAVFTLETGRTYRITVSMPPRGNEHFKPFETEYRAERPGQQMLTAKLDTTIGPALGKDWTVPDLGMEFVWIAALDSWVGKHEVANGEYRKMKPNHDSKRYGYPGYNLNEDRQPAVRVSFDDAKAYALWLTERERAASRLPAGYMYRLPTEQEWMTFAQCGDGRQYPWGNDWPPKYGNYAGQEMAAVSNFTGGINGYNDGHIVSCAVELSGTNDWGLYGVGGNVDDLIAQDSSDSSAAVVRGGNWQRDTPGHMRCSVRWPVVTDKLHRWYLSGFRLMLSH